MVQNCDVMKREKKKKKKKHPVCNQFLPILLEVVGRGWYMLVDSRWMVSGGRWMMGGW